MGPECRGVNSNDKKPQVVRELVRSNPDIAILTELKTSVRNLFSGQLIESTCQGNSGVAILVSPRLDLRVR